MAVLLEISVFGQGTLVLPLKKGGFLVVYVPTVVYVLWSSQRCNLFAKSSAGTSVWYTNFPGIYIANCCNARKIVVENKMAV